MGRWHSFDKHDWCYRGPGFVGTAFLVSDKAYDNSPAHILVWGFAGKFNSHQLHQMLFLTQQQFPHVELWCEYRAELGTQVDELAARGLIQREYLSLGKVRITDLQEPVSKSPHIHMLYERAWSYLASATRKALTINSTRTR